METPKQWIILRKDLNMRKGKCCSQAAHASMKVIFDLWKKALTRKIDGKYTHEYKLCVDNQSALEEWITGAFTKICLSVDSEEQLIEVYERAKAESLLCSLIEDNGTTEFNGVKTKTAVAIGPAYPSEVEHITKDLKLL